MAATASAPQIDIGFPIHTDGGIGSATYLDPFQNTAEWSTALAGASVVTLSVPEISALSDAQLQHIFGVLAAHDVGLSLTTGVIATPAGSGYGLGVEGYVDPSTVLAVVQRIRALGGSLSQITLDAPLYYGHTDTEPNAEQAAIGTLAQQVATTVDAIRSVFPAVQIVDSETPNVGAAITPWLAAFQAATGVAISEVEADVSSGNTGWLAQAEAMSAAVRAAGVGFGIISDAPVTTQSDQAWVLSAEAQMAAAAADPNLDASEIKVASWRYFPTQFGPEGAPDTFAHIAAETVAVAPLYAAGAIGGNPGVPVAIAPAMNGSIVDTVQAVAGAPVGGIGLALSAPGADPIATLALVLTAGAGTLAAAQEGAGGVAGSGSDVLTLSGTLADLNAELATLTYQGTASGSDTIDATLYGGSGLIANADIPVSVAAPIALSCATAVLPSAQAQAQAAAAGMLADLTDTAPDPATVAQWAPSLLDFDPPQAVWTRIALSPLVTAQLTQMLGTLDGGAPSFLQLAQIRAALVGGQTLDEALAPLVAGSAVQATAAQTYAQIIGTAPDPGTLQAMTRSLLLGQSVAALRAGLATSPAVVDAWTNLYGEVYGAAPTAAQLAAMQAGIAGGSSLADELAAIAAYAQAQVAALFAQVLDRAPSATELAVDTRGLENGKGLPYYRGQLALSAQARGLVGTAYTAATGAAASGPTLDQIQHAINGGMTLDQASADLARIVAAFTTIRGAAPAESDVSSLFNLYNAGWTDAQVALAIASAPAPKAALVTAYQSDFHHMPLPATTNALIAQLAGSTLPATLAFIAAAAAADVPAIGGVASAMALPQNDLSYPLRGITLADADANQTETAVVKLSAPIGSLAGGGGSVSADGLTYTSVSGSPALVAALLRNVVFHPNALAAAGAEATLAVSVTNSIGNTTTLTASITDEAVSGAARMSFMFMTPGSDTVAASALADIVVVGGPRFGQDVITGFDPAHDILQLPRADFGNLSHLLADVGAAPGGGAMITYDAQDTITLPGVAPAALNSGNLHLV